MDPFRKTTWFLVTVASVDMVTLRKRGKYALREIKMPGSTSAGGKDGDPRQG